MKNSIFAEMTVSVLLIIFLGVLINPFDLLMPPPTYMIAIVGVAITFLIFAIFIWREKVHDEREELQRHIASRFAYLAGCTTLVGEIIYQSLHHTIDIWPVITLGAMILAKIVGGLYSKMRH